MLGRDFVGKTRNTNTALPVLKARGCVFGDFCDDFIAPNELASNLSVARSLIRYSSGSNRAVGWGALVCGSRSANTYFQVNPIDKTHDTRPGDPQTPLTRKRPV